VSYPRRCYSRRMALAIGVLSLALLLSIGPSDGYGPIVAESHATTAFDPVPVPAARFGPASEDERAFHACARSVVKRIRGERTIVTFAGMDAAVTIPLGGGRFQLWSYLEQAEEDGSRERREFICTVREGPQGILVERLEIRAAPDGRELAVAERES
jgi:hypothetical protein